jgi:hypothetical protein
MHFTGTASVCDHAMCLMFTSKWQPVLFHTTHSNISSGCQHLLQLTNPAQTRSNVCQKVPSVVAECHHLTIPTMRWFTAAVGCQPSTCGGNRRQRLKRSRQKTSCSALLGEACMHVSKSVFLEALSGLHTFTTTQCAGCLNLPAWEGSAHTGSWLAAYMPGGCPCSTSDCLGSACRVELKVQDVRVGLHKKEFMHTVLGGPADGLPLLLLHGYLSGSGFWFR